jgi:TolB protein
VLGLDGKGARNLTNHASQSLYPAWSPDGKRIAFGDESNGAVELFVCDADGSNKKQLTKLGGINTAAAWSPDGKQLLFQRHGDGEETGTLYVIDADGGNQKVVLKGEGPIEGGRASWRPK